MNAGEFVKGLGLLTPDSKIQRRLLARVLPLVIVPILVVGIILWLVINKMTRDQSNMFLKECEQDLITLSGNSALAAYNLYSDFDLMEEAGLYRAEFEAYLKKFMARRNGADEPIYDEIAFADAEGVERIKIARTPSPVTYLCVRTMPFFRLARPHGHTYQSPLQERMIYSRPIYRENSPTRFEGVLVAHIRYPLRRFRARHLTAVIIPPVAIVISIVLAAWVITAQVRRIVQPLRQLVEAAASIAKGDLSVKIDVATGDEVEQLAHSFNYMAMSLDDLIRKIVESQRKYRDLFERSKDGIFIFDMTGRVIDLNPAGLEMLGYGDKEDLPPLSQGAALYLSPADWQAFESGARTRGFVKDLELHLKRKDGAELEVLITGSVRSDLNRTITGYEGVIRDITEKKRLEKELIQSHKMAAISKLVAGVSHEINTPLAAMLSNLRVCARYHEQLSHLVTALDGNDAASQGNGYGGLAKIQPLLASVLGILEETKDAGQKAGGIIAGLKKIYHSGAVGSVLNSIDMNEELKSVLHLYRQTKERITFRCLFSPVPLIPCYNNELTQVFINIINNAIHAMNDAGEITIATSVEGDYVRAKITDQGKGIPPDVLPKIFDPFYTTKGVGEGMGIGLSIVWSIIEKHKGHIYATSEPGCGTTFTIDLPKAS